MQCKDVMSPNVEWLPETATVQRAATVMAEHGVGFLPICDLDRRPIGVVTDRDLITRAIAKKLPAESTPVTQIMSKPAITCWTDAEIRVAEDLMAEEQKARLVITEKDGRLAGILRLANLLDHTPPAQILRTVKVVLSRDALGPRGGAARGTPLLKDDPIAQAEAAKGPQETPVQESVMSGGHWAGGTKEFPG
jgi:CBS domain-containing protein